MSQERLNSTEEIRAKLQGRLDSLASLWGTGPVPIDYAQWVDKTLHLLQGAFGDGSPRVAKFYEAVGEEGSASAQKLPLHGPWGIWARMKAAEIALRQIMADL